MLDLLDDGLERLVVLARTLLHAHDHVAVHLEEATVAIIGEARGGGLLGDDSAEASSTLDAIFSTAPELPEIDDDDMDDDDDDAEDDEI